VSLPFFEKSFKNIPKKKKKDPARSAIRGMSIFWRGELLAAAVVS